MSRQREINRIEVESTVANAKRETAARLEREKLIKSLDGIHGDPIVATFAADAIDYRASDDLAAPAKLIALVRLYRDALALSGLVGHAA